MAFLRKLFRCQKGAAMVEYSMLVAGVALISAAGVSVLGHKTNDMISTVAALLPGAHADDNGPIASGKFIETTAAADGGAPIGVDAAGIATAVGEERLAANLGIATLETLVVEVPVAPAGP
jgi:Flp pilus assembly pilin Flp